MSQPGQGNLKEMKQLRLEICSTPADLFLTQISAMHPSPCLQTQGLACPEKVNKMPRGLMGHSSFSKGVVLSGIAFSF